MASARGNTELTKSVGEMDADELWKTTMDPARRTLYRVKVDDAEVADAIVKKCMGQEVNPRKELILNKVFSA